MPAVAAHREGIAAVWQEVELLHLLEHVSEREKVARVEQMPPIERGAKRPLRIVGGQIKLRRDDLRTGVGMRRDPVSAEVAHEAGSWIHRHLLEFALVDAKPAAKIARQ